MGDVVDLGGNKPKPPVGDNEWIYSCGGCGYTTFQLILGGEVRCTECNRILPDTRHFRPDGSTGF